MTDRDIMENLLLTAKGACDLYMHGAIESSTQNVHTAFKSALSDTLCMQNDIYSQMESKGWYSPAQAEQQKIDKVKQKFSTQG